MNKGKRFQKQLRGCLRLGLSVIAGVVMTVQYAAADRNTTDIVMEEIEGHEQNLHRSKLRVGGWLDILYQDRDTDGYKQILDPHHLYLFFDAQLDARWRTYSEIEIEHVPEIKGAAVGGSSGEGTIKIERMYIENNQSDVLNARVGKFNTPLGIWTPEHWAVNVPSVQKPIHEDSKYVPNKQVGLEVFGNWASSSDNFWSPEINYSVWGSTGEDIFGTNKPTDNKFAYGGDFNITLGEMLKVGLTGYKQSNPGEAGRDEETLFPYTEVYLHDITLTGEYLNQSRDMGGSDIQAWYGALKWQIQPKTYFYYRHDHGEDEKNNSGQKHRGDVLTLGHWPRPYVRTKLEFSTHDFDGKKNYKQWNAWIGVIF